MSNTFKIKIANVGSGGFSRRKATDNYAVDSSGNIQAGVPPMYRIGEYFYGHDAIQEFYNGGVKTEEKQVIIEHPKNDPSFLPSSEGWAVDNFGYIQSEAVIHPTTSSERSEKVSTGNENLDGTIEDILEPIYYGSQASEEFLERGFYGFKVYQIVIVGLVALIIIK